MTQPYQFEIAPGVVCVQPPCPTCDGDCGKWVPLRDGTLHWEPCLLCNATGLEQFTGWPPPVEWCHPAGSGSPARTVMSPWRRLLDRILPWGPE